MFCAQEHFFCLFIQDYVEFSNYHMMSNNNNTCDHCSLEEGPEVSCLWISLRLPLVVETAPARCSPFGEATLPRQLACVFRRGAEGDDGADRICSLVSPASLACVHAVT